MFECLWVFTNHSLYCTSSPTYLSLSEGCRITKDCMEKLGRINSLKFYSRKVLHFFNLFVEFHW